MTKLDRLADAGCIALIIGPLIAHVEPSFFEGTGILLMVSGCLGCLLLHSVRNPGHRLKMGVSLIGIAITGYGTLQILGSQALVPYVSLGDVLAILLGMTALVPIISVTLLTDSH